MNVMTAPGPTLTAPIPEPLAAVLRAVSEGRGRPKSMRQTRYAASLGLLAAGGYVWVGETPGLTAAGWTALRSGTYNPQRVRTPGDAACGPEAAASESDREAWLRPAREMVQFLRATEDVMVRHAERTPELKPSEGCPGRRYWTMYGFVAANGYAFRPPAGPRTIRGVPQHCFANCHNHVKAGGRWVYCEGYALTEFLPFPAHHAWVMDAVTGEIEDPTWEDRGGTAYVGVAFRPEYTRKFVRRCKNVCTVIDHYPTGWPVLRMTPEELAAVTLDPSAVNKENVRASSV